MTKSQVEEVFEMWNQALQSGDPRKVAELYAETPVFLPTLSSRVCTDRDQVEAYFESFLKLQPRAELDESHERIFDDLITHSGLYTFQLQAEKRRVQVRFSFVYQWREGRWQILEHHSSQMPE